MTFWLFPFGSVERESQIVIYGYGAVGKQYLEQIKKTNYCKVLCVADINYASIKSNVVEIISPNSIPDLENYDYVVIANDNEDVAGCIRTNLIDIGVKNDLIVYNNQKMSIEDSLESELREIKYELRSMQPLMFSIDSCTRNLFMSDRARNTRRYAMFSEYSKLLKCKRMDQAINFCRIGRVNDGGYIMADSFENVRIAYSFGICDDVSWDEDIANKGIDVFMYDHTISGLPKDNAKFHFSRIGLSSTRHEENQLLKSLEEIINSNGHSEEKNMILKMDVEGAEIGGIDITPQSVLEQFDQIVMEIHSLTREDCFKDIIRMLKKLNLTHQLVHVHANNFGQVFYAGDIAYSDAIEVSYMRKSNHVFSEQICESANVFDEVCWPFRDEVELL